MAKITIGGTLYTVPELNFIALERAWPYVEQAMATLDPMQGPSAGLGVIAAGLVEADDFERTRYGIGDDERLNDEETFERVLLFLKKKLKATEIVNIKTCLEEILEEAGLTESGELAAAAVVAVTEKLSGVIAQGTSPSSSPPTMKEEAGRA
jgi:hypothetical protein